MIHFLIDHGILQKIDFLDFIEKGNNLHICFCQGLVFINLAFDFVFITTFSVKIQQNSCSDKERADGMKCFLSEPTTASD